MRYYPVEKWDKAERKTNKRGYILVWVPQHPKSFDGGWYYEHRLMGEHMLGRVLKCWETVHHINENKTDNSWLNLFVCTRKEHDYASI